MFIKQGMLAIMATIASAVALIVAPSASAATPACGSKCISVFNRSLGTYAQPNLVEAILGGQARIGQRVGLKQASGSDPAEDIIPRGGLVSDFYAAGMVSAAANAHYGSLQAVQQEYAPFGNPSGLCVGLASVAHQNERLTLQRCSRPGTTVWVINPTLSPTTPGYFPIINASTTDFRRPFAMDLLHHEVASTHHNIQMHVRRLRFLHSGLTLPHRQIWGALFGPLN